MAAASGAETQAVLDELSNEIDRLNKENAALRQRVQLLTHRLFGRRSEKGVPVIEQGVLPFEPAAAGPVQPETTDESQRDETAERAPLRRRHPGRRRLPADLPRERIEVVPPASERHCATCDTAKVRIGADTTEELDYVPASFVIREYVRPKYACARCQQGVVQAVAAGAADREGTTGAGIIGARGHLQVRRSSAAVSAGADLRAPRSGGDPAHPLGVERGGRRPAGTHRARHAPGAGVPVAVDSMRRHDPGCAGPESSAGDSDGTPVGVSGRAGRGGVRLHLVAQPRRAAEDAGRLPWVSPGGRGARL